MKKLMALIIIFTAVVTTLPTQAAATASTTPFHLRSVPNAIVYEMKNNRITPVTTYPVTKRYKVVRPSGWYYVALDGSKQIMIKKSEAKLLLATPLTASSMNSTATRQLAHDYVKTTKQHVPYEYEVLSPERAKQYADRALQGDWYVQTAPFRLAVKNIDTFNWSIPASESNSYPFQIHYLTVLNQLTQAYNDTGDLAYLKYGERIIKSWTKAHPVSNYKQLRWPYNDHGTSIRTFHLLNFWDVYKKTSLHKDSTFTGLLLKTLHEHGTLLATPSFYKTYHNHGIFQDMALTAIAQTFPEFDRSPTWQTLANTRLQTQITHSISKDAVHLEHSPGYQSYMYHTFARFLDWAAANQFVLPPSMANMEDMPKQLTYMLKPNSTLPIFGDTSGAVRTKGIIPDTDNYPELAYALTRGTEGTKPPHVLKRIGSQYSFMREYWSDPPRAFNQATQIMMTAGYHSSAHKHQDDLTIDVYGLGRDFIIETGRYGYTNRPERQHVFKAEAHNIVHRDGEGLDLSSSMREKSRIVTVKNTGPTSIAIGESKLIGKGATHRRTLVYDKAQTLVVYDKITGPTSAKYVQRFHLAEGLKLLKSSIATQNVLYGDTNGRTVQLMQLNLNNSSLRTSTSFVAVRDYEWKPRAQVISYSTGKDVRYVTLIRLDQSKTTITKASVEAVGTNYVVTYTLSNRETNQIHVPM